MQLFAYKWTLKPCYRYLLTMYVIAFTAFTFAMIFQHRRFANIRELSEANTFLTNAEVPTTQSAPEISDGNAHASLSEMLIAVNNWWREY